MFAIRMLPRFNQEVRELAKKKPLLEQMDANPRNDWQIKHVEKLCSQIGLTLEPPSNGSHYKVYSDYLRDVLTIPAHKPIKPPYIRTLVSYAKAHISNSSSKDDSDD